MDYYNEFDPGAAAWLRSLIDAGVIPDGVVDTRSIEDVRPDDLRQFRRCHFFAGIGGWAEALRLADWPDDAQVWTGSCPCQPFSTAGKGGGFADERHLWPAFHHLIEQCQPAVVFGEQVASAEGLGWLDLVRADLEATGYACGAADLCAAGVGAPHIRQRLYWVANTHGRHASAERQQRGGEQRQQPQDGVAGRLGHPERFGAGRHAGAGAGTQGGPELRAVGDDAGPSGAVGRLADATEAGRGLVGRRGGDCARDAGAHADQRHDAHAAGPLDGFWRAADWLLCRDGKWRPVEPGTFPLAHGLPARVGRLRGYGNAIVPQVAATFVRAYLDARAA